MKNLPINDLIDQIKTTVSLNNKVVLEAPPGAGKSTVVPLAFLDQPWLKDKIIIMLEPRRVAARMVASQMAKLLNENLGQRVGYQIKMDKCQSKDTKILVVTEAILVRMLQADQSLQNVAMVIFDEFHERSIHTDLSLALSLEVQEVLRDDLKLLVMSATLNSSELKKLLNNPPVISSQGRTYEVKNIYLPKNISQPNYKTLPKIVTDTILKSLKNDSGDILVFLSGTKEIHTIQANLNSHIDKNSTEILPLYSNLTKKEQDKALLPSFKRKIILSTNIAQTSLTIEGVKVVIDSGFEKLSHYNYANGMDHLELSFIAADSAKQRAGRAGRTSNGVCYKLWHQDRILAPSNKAEILRSDLSSTLLDLALWGVKDISDLRCIDTPKEAFVDETKELLKQLQMIDENFNITTLGKDAISLGVHPRFAFMILKANQLGYGLEACLLSAILTSNDILKNNNNNNNKNKNSDIKDRFMSLYKNQFDSYEIDIKKAKEVLKQKEFIFSKLKKIKKIHTAKNDSTNFDINFLAVLLLFAYPDRLAKQRAKDDLRYKLSNGKGATLNNTDNELFNQPYLVAASLNAHNKDSFINLALSISLENIEKYFSSYFKTSNQIEYEKKKQKFQIKDITSFLKLELISKPPKDLPKEKFLEHLCELIKKENLSLLSWNKKTKQLIEKVNFINHHLNNNSKFQIDFSHKWLLENLQTWLAPFLNDITSLGQLKSLDLFTILLAQIPWEQKKLLDTYLPKTYEVPSGSNIQIDYSDINKPKISVRIQELFGLTQTPKIVNDTIALQIHLLDPAQRPIQITYDIKSFWDNSYEEVAKDLRGKYPKHYWPQNPYEAVATKKTKKAMGL